MPRRPPACGRGYGPTNYRRVTFRDIVSREKTVFYWSYVVAICGHSRVGTVFIGQVG